MLYNGPSKGRGLKCQKNVHVVYGCPKNIKLIGFSGMQKSNTQLLPHENSRKEISQS